MKHIFLISCVKHKRVSSKDSTELYTSPLLTKAIAYARSQETDAIHILSARYGLLPLDDSIPSYNDTLNSFSRAQIRIWAHGVLESLLSMKYSLEEDHYTLLASQHYRFGLIEYMRYASAPLEGMSIDQQLQWLTDNTG